MIVSRPRRVLFVHVHRTGGSTLGDLLRQQLPEARGLGGQHSSITEAPELLGEDVKDYFKFAFVRNPWERIVSWWMLLSQGLRASGSLDTTVPRDLETYLRACLEAAPGGGPRPFPAEQLSLLAETDGPVLVDELGRYERYEDDVRRICERLGLVMGELPRAAATRHDHYRTYYSEEARRLLGALYPRDTRELGYEF